MGFLIIPSLLTDQLEQLKQKVELVRAWGVERLAIDVIDGIFADNLTVGLDDLREIDFNEMDLDIQLLVEEPVDYLGQVLSLQTSGQVRVLAQIEKMGKRDEYMGLCREMDLQVGFALDLYTPIESLTDTELLMADGVLLMSVKAGFSGQKFNPHVLGKIQTLRSRGFNGDVIIDGGMNETTMLDCKQKGANQFAVTSYLWEAKNAQERWELLQRLVKIKQK